MKYSIKRAYFYWVLGRAFVVRMSILRSFVAVCCSFYKLFGVTFCIVLLVAFQEDRKLIMKEPRLCMSNLSHGPIATWSQSSDPKNSIWAPPWLNRGLNSFCQTSFYYDSDKYRARRAVLHTKVHSMIFPIFLYLFSVCSSSNCCKNLY